MQRPKRNAVALWTVVCLCMATTALAQAPLRVGETFPITIDSRGKSDLEAAPTADGRLYTLTHPGATYIALHFAEMDLAPGSSLRISDADGNQSYVLRGRGKMEAGMFWSQHVKGDTVVLELVDRNPDRSGFFVVDEYAAGFVDLGGTEAICGTNDKQNAVCYQASNPTEYDRARAVARLLIQGVSLCTGWLASANDHLVTNEHCISTQTAALNTDYEFASEAPNCNDGNCQLCWAGDVYSGANLIQDNAALDYALVQITSGNPSGTYGFLTIDNRDATIGEQIYIPQHPGGRAKELGIESSHSFDAGGVCHVNSFEPGCSSGAYQDVGYMCDTEGGSSGSPVLATSSHQVIALHHCANCENRGVPIDLVCAEICPLLGPECTVDADCDDSDPCTADACVSGSCEYTPTGPCCGDGTCDTGEDCNTCAADCISGGGSGVCGNGVCEPSLGEDCLSCAADCAGKQNGKPSNRYCCGDGDGENPVDCTDGRCSSGGFACGTPVDPYCCGDGVCEGNEDNANCAVDCPPPVCGDGMCNGSEDSCTCPLDCGAPPATETNCSDGIDNDCDGLTDGADILDCPSCGQKNDPCSSGLDCCSGSCKPNGRCR